MALTAPVKWILHILEPSPQGEESSHSFRKPRFQGTTGRHLSDKPPIQPCGMRSSLNECIGDFALIEKAASNQLPEISCPISRFYVQVDWICNPLADFSLEIKLRRLR
jgi:hypothetical protein